MRLKTLLLALAVWPVASMQSHAQDAAIYVVGYVEVMPASTSAGAALLKQLGAATAKDDGTAAVKQLGEDGRKDSGNLLFEVVVQTNRPNHFTVLEAWKDLAALNAHSAAA